MRIKSLSISAVRGIKRLDMDIDEKSLLIFGENGMGKSSIVDAIDYFFTGTISYLDNNRGTSFKEHGRHAKSTIKEMKVSAVINPGTVTVTRSGKKSLKVPENLKESFDLGSNGNFIIRRHQILGFIQTNPSDRYAAIGQLLGVEVLDDNSLAFLRAKNHFSDRLRATKESKQNLLNAASQIIGVPITDLNDILPILNSKLAEDGYPALESFSVSHQYANELLAKTRFTSIPSSTISLQVILQKISQVELNQLVDSIKWINDQVEKLGQKEFQSKLSSMNLLREGQKLLESEKGDACPLCEQPIESEEVLQKVQARLKVLESLAIEASEFRSRCAAASTSLTLARQALADIRQSLEKLEGQQAYSEKDGIASLETQLKAFTDKAEGAKETGEKIGTDAFVSLVSSASKLLGSLEARIRAQIESQTLNDNEKSVVSWIGTIEGAKMKYEELVKMEQQLISDQKAAEYADKMYKAYSETTKLTIQEINDSIAVDVGQFYAEIHPKEDHGKIKLVLDEDKRASTKLRVQSFDQEVDPRAYQSEGHLDSLGICIFLAFFKKFYSKFDLMVLDDIVTAIDAHHRMRICELIYKYFKDLQLIITTHDLIWYEILQSNQSRFGIQGRFMNIKIDDWDLHNGLTIRGYKPPKDHVQEQISLADKTGAGNGTRQYLEALLRKTCENLEVSLRFSKDGKYELREMTDAAQKRVKDLVKDCDWRTQVIEQFKKVSAMTMYSNIVSHANLDAANISMGEIEDFFKEVLSLEEKISCSSCKELPKYDREAHEVRCKNHLCTNQLIVHTRS